MFKFVTIFRRVDDPAAVEAFFSSTQLPLSEQLPGLLRSEVSRIFGKPGGSSRYYLMYEIYFTDGGAYHQAIRSEAGIKLAQALKPWHDAKIITMFFAETFAEDRPPADTPV